MSGGFQSAPGYRHSARERTEYFESPRATGIKITQMHETHTGRWNILILRPYLWSIKGEEEFAGEENMLRRIPARTWLERKRRKEKKIWSKSLAQSESDCRKSVKKRRQKRFVIDPLIHFSCCEALCFTF